ncbi:hypothetical protein [Alteraurantiacibacter palmitatis]|uniref:Uncharacterized protein n=1 Tax=Alteraurantiacibacter palmitatis TaxID=2054628 RepID=A0ABV7E6Q6_9SPHN
MNELDRLLGHLRAAPAPDRLAGIDGEVLAAVSARRAGSMAVSNASFALVAVLALFVGIIGSGVTQPHPMRMPLAPFGVPSALAPSTLLAETP